MSYLAQITGDEAKHLLSNLIHRIIDMRVEGQENDRMMREVDSENDLLRKTLRRQDHDRNVQKTAYDMKLRNEEKIMNKKIKSTVKELDRTLEELREEKARAEKYKKFYNYCISNHKEDHHHHHRSDTPKNSRNNDKSDKNRGKPRGSKLTIKPTKAFIDSTED